MLKKKKESVGKSRRKIANSLKIQIEYAIDMQIKYFAMVTT